MYYAPKVLLFIKKCLPNLPNLLYILTCIVPLNDSFSCIMHLKYSFSLKNVFLWIPSQFAVYTYMYCPPKHLNDSFSLKNVLLTFPICYIFLYVLSP